MLNAALVKPSIQFSAKTDNTKYSNKKRGLPNSEDLKDHFFSTHDAPLIGKLLTISAFTAIGAWISNAYSRNALSGGVIGLLVSSLLAFPNLADFYNELRSEKQDNSSKS